MVTIRTARLVLPCPLLFALLFCPLLFALRSSPFALCPMPPYIELHSRSAFSFLEGASVPEDLIAEGLALEMPAMALLDRDGFYGAPRFHLAAKKNGLKAHIGAELKVSGLQSKKIFTLPLLVQTRTGYQNLCRLITLMKLRVPKHAKPEECVVTPAELAMHAQGLICLTGMEDGPLGIPNARMWRAGDREKQIETANWLADVFGKGNVYAELQRHFDREEEAHNQVCSSRNVRLHGASPWHLVEFCKCLFSLCVNRTQIKVYATERSLQNLIQLLSKLTGQISFRINSLDRLADYLSLFIENHNGR